MQVAEIGLLAAGGAAAQEVLWWYNRRHKLDEKALDRLLRSRGYWIITLGFIILSGLLSLAMLDGIAGISKFTCLYTGAAMPLILKQFMTAGQPQQHLGPERGFSLRDYLR